MSANERLHLRKRMVSSHSSESDDPVAVRKALAPVSSSTGERAGGLQPQTQVNLAPPTRLVQMVQALTPLNTKDSTMTKYATDGAR